MTAFDPSCFANIGAQAQAGRSPGRSGDLHNLQAADIDSNQGPQTGTAYSRRNLLQAHKGKEYDDRWTGTNPQTLQIAHTDCEAVKL